MGNGKREEDHHYDLVVIGSGPAGERGAAQAAYFGKKVALVEAKSELGGACANTGTLPSKTLRETALYLSGLKQRDIYGAELTDRTGGICVRDFMANKERVVESENARIRRNLEEHGIELVTGFASFVDAHKVSVALPEGGTRELSADVFLVATGSSPWHPPGIPFDDPDVDDSDEVLGLDCLPNHFVVMGGGVIGSEYASLFAALGIGKVTLVERRDRLLQFLDEEMSDAITEAFRHLGIDVILSEEIVDYGHPDDEPGVIVTLKSGKTLEADRLLVAAGRSSNIEGLNLDKIGVEIGERGKVVVDEHYQTSVPHIFAAGDIVGFPSLAATSMEQGRVAMCKAFGFDYKDKLDPHFPYGLYTIPEVSYCGLTEAQAREKHEHVEVGRAYYRDNARGQIVNDREGFMKIVFDAKSKEIYGVHILGDRATELVHIGQAVMKLGGTIDYFVDGVFNYPTLSEIYKYAAYDGLGNLAKRSEQA